jgi:hypothetical protein
MSYDKYIKYKSKYLQLKAKYTQVGGAGMWTISKKEGQKDTTPITQEESDALNKVISNKKGQKVIIKHGELRDMNGNKLINYKDGIPNEMNYKYVINADGKSGTRISLKGEYDMSLLSVYTKGAYGSSAPASSAPVYALPSTPRSVSGASAHPGAYGSSAPASSAPVYALPSTPRSASSVPFLYEIPNLPVYFTISNKFDSNTGQRYIEVCVKKFELMQHLTKIGDSIIIDGIKYTKNTGSTIQMKTKNNYIYQLNNTGEGDTFRINYI